MVAHSISFLIESSERIRIDINDTPYRGSFFDEENPYTLVVHRCKSLLQYQVLVDNWIDSVKAEVRSIVYDHALPPEQKTLKLNDCLIAISDFSRSRFPNGQPEDALPYCVLNPPFPSHSTDSVKKKRLNS